MIPVGYMYKSISKRPDWLKSASVKDIYSVSGCVSKDFDNWIPYWKHNGYWLFDTPQIIEDIAVEHGISLEGMQLFFYKTYAQQWDDAANAWVAFEAEVSFPTHVQEPADSVIEGYDVVSFSGQVSAECSPLSCNSMAAQVEVNAHCLLHTLHDAQTLLESGTFKNCEPGPYRIFQVHRPPDRLSIDWRAAPC